MARLRIAAGNWKMNTTVTEGFSLAEQLAKGWSGDGSRQMILAPPFTHLIAVQTAVKDSSIRVAAQNCHWEAKGAFTGEVSPAMLKAMQVEYVILGHSERREIFGESNAIVKQKTDAALQAGLKVIFCCGEPLSVRENGDAMDFVRTQLEDGLVHLSGDQYNNVVIAYEPIWAIGTGVTATADQAQEMHAFIRSFLTEKYSSELADRVTILYGGSVKGNNAAELFSQPDVDGGLVGGASLKADEFLEIGNAL